MLLTMLVLVSCSDDNGDNNDSNAAPVSETEDAESAETNETPLPQFTDSEANAITFFRALVEKNDVIAKLVSCEAFHGDIDLMISQASPNASITDLQCTATGNQVRCTYRDERNADVALVLQTDDENKICGIQSSGSR